MDTPFEDLKADINNTFAGLQFNESTLFVPQQDSVSFCGQMDTSVVDDLGHDLAKLTKIGIVVLVVKSNWGMDEYTCLYRMRVHGERMGEIPPPLPEEYAQ